MWSKMSEWSLRLMVRASVWSDALVESNARRSRGQAGQSTLEYAVISALIVTMVMGAIQYFTQGVSTVFRNLVTRISGL